MSDVATPAAIAASGVPLVLFFGSLGLDPASMGAGLGGVVIAQTLLPATVNGLRSVVGLGLGSMLLASYSTPFLAPFVLRHLPDWAWLASVPSEHVKAASAAFIGAFAQPILLWVRSLLPSNREPSPSGKVPQ
jgi:hypothetical protein